MPAVCSERAAVNGGGRLQRTVARARDVESLSREIVCCSRAGSRGRLNATTSVSSRALFGGRAGLRVLVGGVVLLIPWIAGLSLTLPADHSSHQWRPAWSGFDVALNFAFA